jgi:dipeptidyl aminopeptidase/acylaminoacyl peptidase
MRCYDAETGAAGPAIEPPEPGVVSSHAGDHPLLSGDGARVYFTLTTPRLAGDVFAHDRRTGETRRLTHSPAPVSPDELVSAERGEVASFDGERIPLFLFRPVSGEELAPVVVLIHGGPESQSVLAFNPLIQGLALAGYAVVVPNVRGSTGYGRRYAALDDTTRRLDSVRDLAAVHGFLWAAGVDIVGISDLVTFLENTSAYRRAHREREYGSLEHDREFLASASPLRHADAIRAPLFVIHGRNDPRVPVSETEQLVENLTRRGVRCHLEIYEDEGHGLARLANRLDAYPKAVAFLDDVLGR